MRVSELNADVCANFCRADADSLFETLLLAAKQYVRSETGLTDEEMDLYEDIPVAVLCLVSEMYDNRQLSVETTKVNAVCDSILGRYRQNLLPKG